MTKAGTRCVEWISDKGCRENAAREVSYNEITIGHEDKTGSPISVPGIVRVTKGGPYCQAHAEQFAAALNERHEQAALAAEAVA